MAAVCRTTSIGWALWPSRDDARHGRVRSRSGGGGGGLNGCLRRANHRQRGGRAAAEKARCVMIVAVVRQLDRSARGAWTELLIARGVVKRRNLTWRKCR